VAPDESRDATPPPNSSGNWLLAALGCVVLAFVSRPLAAAWDGFTYVSIGFSVLAVMMLVLVARRARG